MSDARAELFSKLYRDRPLAHRFFFPHRHPNETPPFHREMIDLWHAPADLVVDGQQKPNIDFMAFRGGAKSTIGEEAIVIMAGLREFKNCLILGENADRAGDRLRAISHEIEHNERWREVFGASIVSYGKDFVELSTNVMIQSRGSGQSLRGIKYLDMRPDLVFIDDLEDRQDVTTPENRRKVKDWFLLDLFPATDPDARMRMAATPLDPDSLPMNLIGKDDWLTKVYPIETLDADGERIAQWPDRFPLKDIDKLKKTYFDHGRFREYRQEFECRSEAAEEKPFVKEMTRIEPQVRTWQAVYAFFDPARTVKRESATTGFACWSWINSRLIVWDSWGRRIMPDEIVHAIFDVHLEHRCTWIGVEEDGLNEFLMQPIRHEQARRGEVVPVKAMKAPRGKIDFIKGLQPFFKAREVVLAKPQPDLQQQLLSFPTGVIDVPNALAYALRMRPGAPIYDDFGASHLTGTMIRSSSPMYLCLNATGAMTTAVLCQAVDGAFKVFWDCVREGEPLAVLPDIITLANIESGIRPRIVVPPHHFDKYNNVGLVQAIKRIPMEVRKGVAPETGRDHLRGLMRREIRGMAAFQISSDEDSAAHWTLNALAGGYARVVKDRGMLADYPEEGMYRTLMEGIESFAGLLHLGQTADDDDRSDLRYATNGQGRRYLSARGSN